MADVEDYSKMYDLVSRVCVGGGALPLAQAVVEGFAETVAEDE